MPSTVVDIMWGLLQKALQPPTDLGILLISLSLPMMKLKLKEYNNIIGDAQVRV